MYLPGLVLDIDLTWPVVGYWSCLPGLMLDPGLASNVVSTWPEVRY